MWGWGWGYEQTAPAEGASSCLPLWMTRPPWNSWRKQGGSCPWGTSTWRRSGCKSQFGNRNVCERINACMHRCIMVRNDPPPPVPPQSSSCQWTEKQRCPVHWRWSDVHATGRKPSFLSVQHQSRSHMNRPSVCLQHRRTELFTFFFNVTHS